MRSRTPSRASVAALAALLAALLPGVARADVVDEWNKVAIDLATNAAPNGAGLGPPFAGPHIATASLAIYDTAMAFGGRTEPYHAHPVVPDGASFEAAVATAGHDAIVGRLPAMAPLADARYAATLATVPDGQAKLDGIAVGQAVAADLLALRAGDGYGVDRPEYYVAPPPAAGVWVPIAGRGVFPWVGHLVPFVLQASDQFLAPPPPRLTSKRWARDYNEVKALGGVVSDRTPEQTSLALFFTDHATQQWNRVARQLADREDLGPRARARLYAELATASADALIGCWATKYEYLWWRPEGAITTTFDDGNPRTTPDPTWRPLRPTPNFADHTSGHSCITSASMAVFQRFFGSDRMTFTVTSHPAGESPATGLLHDRMTFHRFSDAVDAMADARILLGYHYRSAVDDGAQIGRRTVRWMLDHAFQPVDDDAWWSRR
jgi:hypothetical protein